MYKQDVNALAYVFDEEPRSIEKISWYQNLNHAIWEAAGATPAMHHPCMEVYILQVCSHPGCMGGVSGELCFGQCLNSIKA